MVDGVLVLSNRNKKKLRSHIESYPYYFGHLTASYDNMELIQPYLENRREDQSKSLSRDQFLAQMYLELTELLGFVEDSILKRPTGDEQIL